MNDQASASNKTPAELRKLQAIAFALPSLGVVFFMGPMGVIQGIYAKYYGIALTSLAAVLLVSRLFDAVTDPLIGHFSDRHRARTGTRKPFVLIGGICLIPCGYFLFVPPENVTVAYFTFWSLAFYLTYTIYHIPHYAWAAEMTTDQKGRAAVFSWLYIMGQAGSMLFYLIPFLPVFATTEITPLTIKISAILGIFLVLPGLYFTFKFAPDGRAPVEEANNEAKSHKDTLLEFVQIMHTNKPFQVFAAAHLCMGLGLGMWSGLLFIFVDAFLGLGEEFVKMALFGIVGSIMITPLCYKLTLKVGKRNTWLLASSAIIFGVGYTGFLIPGNADFIDLLILQILVLIGSVFGAIVSPIILSDTVDYGSLKDKTERTGTYFAIFSLLVKAQGALGAALGLAFAGWFGFDATATEYNESSAFGIHLAVSWIPLVVTSTGLFFVWLTPLNARRNAIICRHIDSRARRIEID